MYLAFEALPNHSRVWIYQSDRKLKEQEINLAQEQALQFVEQWAAHGAPVQGSYKILHNQFLVLAVNEDITQPSGCSIDSSVKFIKNLEQAIGVNFFDRTKVAFLKEGDVFQVSLNHIKTNIEEGIINSQTQTFNNLVQSKEELENNWVIPAGSSWIKRYF